MESFLKIYIVLNFDVFNDAYHLNFTKAIHKVNTQIKNIMYFNNWFLIFSFNNYKIIIINLDNKCQYILFLLS